jgi:hypothetical protein
MSHSPDDNHVGIILEHGTPRTKRNSCASRALSNIGIHSSQKVSIGWNRVHGVVCVVRDRPYCGCCTSSAATTSDEARSIRAHGALRSVRSYIFVSTSGDFFPR